MSKINRALKLLIEKTNKVHDITHQNKLLILIDILYCFIKHGADPIDYYEFSFYELDRRKRNTYATRNLNLKIRKALNDESYTHKLSNKGYFAKEFNVYMKREWLLTQNLNIEDLKNFIQNKEKIIYKPVGTQQGDGIEKINLSAYEDVYDLYQYIKGKETDAILEEWIVQHEDISKLYDKAINPLRVVTVNKSGKAHVLISNLTIGSKREIANAAGDMISPVDIKTGKLKYPAADKHGNVYVKHPITQTVIQGTQIPYWDDVLSLAKIAAKVVPEVGYIGWDIAITPKGPVLIEGNTAPGYRSNQYKSHLSNQIGKTEIYENVLIVDSFRQ